MKPWTPEWRRARERERETREAATSENMLYLWCPWIPKTSPHQDKLCDRPFTTLKCPKSPKNWVNERTTKESIWDVKSTFYRVVAGGRWFFFVGFSRRNLFKDWWQSPRRVTNALQTLRFMCFHRLLWLQQTFLPSEHATCLPVIGGKRWGDLLICWNNNIFYWTVDFGKIDQSEGPLFSINIVGL